MVQLIDSTDVIISNPTFRNSPFWNIHPVNCSQVIVQNVTIIAPLDSPNTDGIDPDSSDDLCIEDCYISTGDDLIAIKSGWDEYGIFYAHPSTNIIIHRIVGQTTSSSGIAIGSEMSGGVSQVHVEDIHFFNSNRGVSIKTARGRGGYVRSVFITGVILSNLKVALKFIGNYGEHPDKSYDTDALPLIENISIQNVTRENIKVVGLLEGIEGDTFKHICLYDINLDVRSKSPWICSNVEGFSDKVSPDICEPLKPKINPDSKCYQMSNHLWSISPRSKGTWLQ